ncbi:hypothetical protein C8Q79DRAFT_926476 [Trametes meyenii]|nr:hypothetical protein C8Q79DRAFT_926476 [Trametes meyenii]
MAAVASCSSLPLYSMASASSAGSSSAASSSRDSASPEPTPQQRPTFALAQIKGDVCLVQVPDAPAPDAMSSALMAADVAVFRHEFITLFRYSHSATLHPADVHILEPIADACTLYEEDKGTVFLARDVMARLQKLSMAARQHAYAHPHTHSRHHSHPHPHAYGYGYSQMPMPRPRHAMTAPRMGIHA